jgi:hypothetical protein
LRWSQTTPSFLWCGRDGTVQLHSDIAAR